MGGKKEECVLDGHRASEAIKFEQGCGAMAAFCQWF